jgi:hypothetical protein
LSEQLNEDAYLEQVERSLELQQAAVLLLDLVRRCSAGDRRGVRERSRYMMPPRQRILVRKLLEWPGLPREVGLTLERLREQPGEFGGPDACSELEGLGWRVEQLLRRFRVKGRIS